MGPVIEECVYRLTGLNALAVEVGEHLLASLGIRVHEENDRDGFGGEGRVFGHSLKDGFPTVLSVVDHELRIERDLQLSDAASWADGFEDHVLIDGGRQRGEDIGVPVIEDVLLDLRYTFGIQVALDAVERLELAVVEDGHALHHAIGPHCDVVNLVGLNAAYDWERDGGGVSIHMFA